MRLVVPLHLPQTPQPSPADPSHPGLIPNPNVTLSNTTQCANILYHSFIFICSKEIHPEVSQTSHAILANQNTKLTNAPHFLGS